MKSMALGSFVWKGGTFPWELFCLPPAGMAVGKVQLCGWMQQ